MQLRSEDVLANGTEVLIFKYIAGWIKQDTKNFIKGIIVDSELSENVSYYGKPSYVVNYTVLGEDGNTYFGNMNNHVIGENFFMTKKGYISYLNDVINNNNEKIERINKENSELLRIIKYVKDIKINSNNVKNGQKKIK